ARNVFRGAQDDPNQLGAELRPVPGGTWQRPFPDGKEPDPRTPVVQVSWNDAREYARWAGLLLPSEDEWEKAAAWDPVTCVHRDFAWGDELPTDHAPGNFRDAAFYRHDGVDPGIELLDDGFHWLSPVGQFRDDCSPYGAFDVTGNVVQWCRDDVAGAGPGSGNERRIFKGGSWAIPIAWCKLSRRSAVTPEFR